MPHPTTPFGWILPVGTHVVTRAEIWVSRGHLICPAGTVGMVVKAPSV